jgi:NitT/TauT family transport system substrate-binding protein
MKRFLLAVFAVLVLSSGPSHAEGLAPVKLGINKLGAMTNVWVAEKTGIFKKHGLDLQVIEIPLTDQSIPLLQSKSVDIVLQIPGTAMVAKEQGFDIVMIGQNETAGTTPPVSNAIMVAVNSPIHGLADLRGKRISTSSTHGQGFAALKEILQRSGVSTDQVQLNPVPFTVTADLLRTGQVDAAVALDPYTTQITKAGIGRTISWYMMETIPDQPVGSWWALRSWAKQHPQEVIAFGDAVKESQDYLNSDRDRATQAVADYSGLDINLVKNMPPIQWKSTVDPKAWQAVADMMYRQGELTNHHDVAEYLPQ